MYNIIFDFDGVIEDTFELHRQKVKEFTGVALNKKSFRELHNGNIFNNVDSNLQKVDWFKYQEFIHKDLSNLKIKQNIKKALQELSQNHKLFIITSGSRRNILDYLKNNNVNMLFEEVAGIELHKSKIDKFNFIFKKYNLKQLNCIFITDTLGDILEANSTKIKTIAVEFGYHDKKTLNTGKPFKIVHNFNEILNFFRTN